MSSPPAARSAPDRTSILDRMLHTADPDSGKRLDDDNIINQILTLLIAGSETTANTIAFALHHLAGNPAAWPRARAEVDQLLARHGATRSRFRRRRASCATCAASSTRRCD